MRAGGRMRTRRRNCTFRAIKHTHNQQTQNNQDRLMANPKKKQQLKMRAQRALSFAFPVTRSLHVLCLVLLVVLSMIPSALSAESDGDDGHGEATEHEEHEHTDPYAVLFPFFVMALGIFVYYLMTRYFHAIPYTAIMFLIGTLMGIGASLSGNVDQLTTSMRLWAGIDGHVILLAFLPGLLFWDALDVNFRLFCASISQLLIMAFPMVLAGASLTALVAYYVFPYGWSFMLSLTFGSILAATDPVAVSALLKEVGAPPRLKMHISGESMLNDGSAVVFYTIFSSIFLYELDIGLGDTFTVGEGFALFFRMAGGGCAVGIAFGIGLIALLYHLNRRLDHEENINQVAATATVAYLSFYTGEMVCHMSGVIAVVFTGITARAFGGGMINCFSLMESFWHLVEHFLNTILFSLGGIVWGSIISNARESKFDGRDWGYLFLLYVLVQAIRFLLNILFYPLLSRIGLGLNWQEAFFLSYSGLRGAVGIALAVSLDNMVFAATTPEDAEARDYTTTLFGHVGGIAFLTLWLNGTFAGPLLLKLGLAKPTETRVKVLERFESHYHHGKLIDLFVNLLADKRFALADFAVVKYHVPQLAGLTVNDLKEAVQRNKIDKPLALENVLSYIRKDEGTDTSWAEEAMKRTASTEEGSNRVSATEDVSVPEVGMILEPDNDDGNNKLIREYRLAYLDILKAAYEIQVANGELDSRVGGGLLVHSLEESIDFASDAVVRGSPIEDWEAAFIPNPKWAEWLDLTTRKVTRPRNKEYKKGERANTVAYRAMKFDAHMALSFIHAHRQTQEKFHAEFLQDAKSDEAANAAKTVLSETEKQIAKAEDLLQSYDHKDICVMASHLFCVILLNKVARDAEELCHSGVLKEKEAHKYVEQVEDALHGIEFCTHYELHPGEHEKKEDDRRQSVVCMLDEMKSHDITGTIDLAEGNETKNV